MRNAAPPPDSEDVARSPAARSYLRSAAMLCGLAAAGLLFLSVFLHGGFEDTTLCLLAVSALAATAFPLLFLRRIELYEPIWFVMAIVGIGVTGKAFYLVFGPRGRVSFLLLDKTPGDLIFAALVMSLALLTFSVAYLLGGRRWSLPLDSWLSGWDDRRFYLVSGLMVAFGLTCFALFVWRLDLSFETWRDFSSPRYVVIPGARYRGAMGYLRWGASFTEFGFFLVYTLWVAKRRRVWSRSGLLVGVLGLLAVAFPIFASTRYPVSMLLARCVVIWIILRGFPKLRYLVALGSAGLVLVAGMLAVRQGASNWSELRSALGVGGILEATVGSRHFLDLTKTAHILDAVPEEVEFRYGETLFTWLVAPIPRALWPQKPAIGAGKDLGPTVFGTPRSTGVPPGIVAELYLNLGMPGIFVGLALFGLFLRSLYETFRPHLAIPGAALLYTLLSTRLTLDLMATQISGSMAKLLQEAVPIVLALAVISRRADQKRIPTASVLPTPRSREGVSARHAPL